jgi:hypothetical protein
VVIDRKMIKATGVFFLVLSFLLGVSITLITLRYNGDSESNQPTQGKTFASIASIADIVKSKVSKPINDVEEVKALTKCATSFPSSCDIYPYVKFWNQRYGSEDCYQSPLKHPKGKNAPITEKKYVVFEPDRGGWNNIRMAAEVAMIFAHATGRILVMPPMAVWYLLRLNKAENDNQSTFAKFFDVKKISEAMEVISMEEFINTIAAKGMLKVYIYIYTCILI